MKRWRTRSGIRGAVTNWSSGRPNTYLGTIHAPRRAARKTRSAVCVASTAMSIAELPIPSTTHPLAGEQLRVVARVVVRVHLHAREVVGPGEGGLRPARVPVVAVGDQQRAVLAHLPRVERHPPAAVDRLRALDPGLERDPLAQAEVVDVGVEVRGHLRVVREVRIVGRHREVRVGHPVARGVDVQGLVGARHPVGVAEDPVPADAVGLLEAVEGDPAPRERLDRRDPGRAGPDHTRRS